MERIAEATRALALDVERIGRRRADLGAAAGMVSVFTGLVQDLGRVTAVDATDDGVTLGVRTRLAGEIAEGDSVAVNGVCLTATAIADGEFRAEVMHETLRRSSLAEATAGLRRQPRAVAARVRPARRPHRAGPRRRARARCATSARTASPAS